MTHSQHHKPKHCLRQLTEQESLVIHADFDPDEMGCLLVIRKFCQSFAPQTTDAWTHGFFTAESIWGEVNGPMIAHRLMHVLQAMRASRLSVFSFSTPDCPVCSQVLTEHERRLITAIRFVRQGRPEQAALQLLLLCEGNPTEVVMERLQDLSTAFTFARELACPGDLAQAAYQ
ncbi:MAG: hypothetical protein AAF999_07955 [Pseudomonadota bacterium]